VSEQQGFSSRRLVFVVAAAASLLLLASLLAVIFGQTRESALAQSKASLDGKAYVRLAKNDRQQAGQKQQTGRRGNDKNKAPRGEPLLFAHSSPAGTMAW
jgi:hypothetical protein